jgi:hypothetical protein
MGGEKRNSKTRKPRWDWEASELEDVLNCSFFGAGASDFGIIVAA